MQDGEQLLGTGCAKNEGAGLVVVFRALFPSGQTGEDDGTAFKAFGAVDGVFFKEKRRHFDRNLIQCGVLLLNSPATCFLYASF